MRFRDTETRCHCGAAYAGSDHCGHCGCEQYETQNVRWCGRDVADTEGSEWTRREQRQRVERLVRRARPVSQMQFEREREYVADSHE